MRARASVNTLATPPDPSRTDTHPECIGLARPIRRDTRAMAGATGLEPATSGVTGRRSNQLSYAPATRSRRHLLARRSRGVKQLPGRIAAIETTDFGK